MAGVIKKFKPFIGPKSFVFVDPDTGFKYAEETKERLFKRIVDYRSQNELEPIVALERVLENYWCSLAENAGNCEMVPLRRGWYHYLKGGVSLVENLFFGEKNLVTQEMADSRASLCIKCPYNVFPDKGRFVEWSDEIAEASTGGKKSKYHEELGNCDVCSCPLRAKVWNKKATLTEEESAKAPEFCWAKKREK